MSGWGEVVSGRSEFQLHRYEFAGPYVFQPNAYLKKRGLKHTLHKSGGKCTYVLPKDSQKKKVLLSCESEPLESGGRVSIVCGKKFQVGEFLREAFLTGKEEWRRISARHVCRWILE